MTGVSPDLADSHASRPVPVTVMIFTLNEEIHLPSCLDSLAWCEDVIIIDSFSTDRTAEISRARNARFFQHAFEGFGKQRNWALDNTAPKHEWILILDADERVTPQLREELRDMAATSPQSVGAYRIKRRFHMWGRWLKYSSLYPTYVVRAIRRDRVRYINRGHAETQEVEGGVAELKHDLIDENLKGINEWFERQNRYSTSDAAYELESESKPLQWGNLLAADPLARRAALKRLASILPGRPLLYFFYSYVVRRGFLDGKDGLMFCLMKATYQRMVTIKKHDLRRQRRND